MSASEVSRPAGLLSAILITGLIVGTLDIAGAIIYFLTGGIRNPIVVFQYIASSVIESHSVYEGGALTAALGFAMHYCIAFVWTAVYYYLYPSLQRVLSNRTVAGILYGLVIWLTMNFAALPLTKLANGPIKLKGALIGALILVVAIGIPLAYRASAFYNRKNS